MVVVVTRIARVRDKRFITITIAVTVAGGGARRGGRRLCGRSRVLAHRQSNLSAAIDSSASLRAYAKYLAVLILLSSGSAG